MKKLIALIIMALMLAACNPEFYKHDTLYATNQHAAFSLWGYKSIDNTDLKNSQEQGWWGDEVPYIPAD